VLKLRRSITWIIPVCVSMVLVAVGSSWAADRPRDLIHAYRVWKLTDLLDLTEEQMPLFFARLRLVDEAEAQLVEEETMAVRHIAEILGRAKLDEPELERALAEHAELRSKRLMEIQKLREEAMSELNLKQRGQYVVFEHRFRSELRDMIQRARELGRDRGLEKRDAWEENFGGPGGPNRGGNPPGSPGGPARGSGRR
jgi:hypothetical protein